jgi:hypothetical protein
MMAKLFAAEPQKCPSGFIAPADPMRAAQAPSGPERLHEIQMVARALTEAAKGAPMN